MVDPWGKVTLREFLEEKIGHLSTRVSAIDAKFDAALLSQEKATASAFVASEKAIVKSEDAQRELNIKNNEFRGQLKDQAEVLMPRSETLSMFKNMEDKLINIKNETEIKFELLRKELQGLRESRSEGGGKSAGVQLSWAILIAAIGIIGTIISILVGASVLLRK